MAEEMPEVLLVPFTMQVDGVKVTVYEILKSKLVSGDEWYHVVLSIEVAGRRTNRFTIDAKSWHDFMRKLLAEISKIKLALMAGAEV